MSGSPPDTDPAGVAAAEAVLQNPATLRDLLSVRAYVWFWAGADLQQPCGADSGHRARMAGLCGRAPLFVRS